MLSYFLLCALPIFFFKVIILVKAQIGPVSSILEFRKKRKGNRIGQYFLLGTIDTLDTLFHIQQNYKALSPGRYVQIFMKIVHF